MDGVAVDDPRRALPITIEWNGDLIGRVNVGGQYWAAVEWSEKRQEWCIEDAEGRCLSHKSHIHGQAAARDDAVTLAEAMIRDGRMPTPEQAAAARKARIQKRRNQPAQMRRRIQRREEKDRVSDLMGKAFDAEWREKDEQPLFELLAEVFDFSDPELWKSNSFAALRPRLTAHVAAAVARLEYDYAQAMYEVKTEPFMMNASKETRRAAREHRHNHANQEAQRIAEKLERARQTLEQLRGGDDAT